jgi:nucleoid-associated protein YgaU
MSDVEKYGLFAIVLVGGLLLIIAVSGGFSSEEPPAAPALATAGAPIVLDQPAPMRGPDGDAAGLRTVHVPPLLPTDRSSFDWSEPPVAYPGERSSAAPKSEPAASAPATEAPAVAASPKSTAPAVPSSSATPAAKSDASYVVRNGDTLADIAQRQLGSAKRWPELVKLNPGLDPKNLKIGTRIRLGDAAAAPLAAAPAKVAPVKATGDKAVASAARTHTVVAGDTLGAIAKKYLGSMTRANDLYEANRDVLKSPDALKIGQVLRIP